jgi:hypothetical protein
MAARNPARPAQPGRRRLYAVCMGAFNILHLGDNLGVLRLYVKAESVDRGLLEHIVPYD